jgi:hypothetical protein
MPVADEERKPERGVAGACAPGGRAGRRRCAPWWAAADVGTVAALSRCVIVRAVCAEVAT